MAKHCSLLVDSNYICKPGKILKQKTLNSLYWLSECFYLFCCSNHYARLLNSYHQYAYMKYASYCTHSYVILQNQRSGDFTVIFHDVSLISCFTFWSGLGQFFLSLSALYSYWLFPSRESGALLNFNIVLKDSGLRSEWFVIDLFICHFCTFINSFSLVKQSWSHFILVLMWRKKKCFTWKIK